MATYQQERHIEQLERELERDDLTAEDRAGILDEIRDVEREIADENRWRDEGEERGWR